MLGQLMVLQVVSSEKLLKEIRKYDDSYMALGFINNTGNPQYVICCKGPSTSFIDLAKMCGHLESAPSEFVLVIRISGIVIRGHELVYVDVLPNTAVDIFRTMLTVPSS
ncbi:hypothetical protein Trydic_g3017 [Trypoxylus dichotomus]